MTPTLTARPLLLSLLATSLMACSDPETRLPDPTSDMGDARDLSPDIEDMTADTDPSVDSGADLSDSDLLDMAEDSSDLSPQTDADMEAPDQGEMEEGTRFGTCEGDCLQTGVLIDFGGTQRTLTHAFYGLSRPERSINGGWELYIEASEGGTGACPAEDSATPEQSLVITGATLPMMPATLSRPEDAIHLILFDFEGPLVPDPPFRSTATTATLSLDALDVCEPCVLAARPDDDGFVALTLNAVFPEGSVSGQLHAIHCTSLDD